MRSWRSVHREYDRLRRRYYLDAEDPLRVPPPAAEVRWAWIAPRSCDMARTHFDPEGDPHLILVPHDAADRVLTLLLLHELSHIRNPGRPNDPRSTGARCLPADAWWRAEARRLAAADAFTRERVF